MLILRTLGLLLVVMVGVSCSDDSRPAESDVARPTLASPEPEPSSTQARRFDARAVKLELRPFVEGLASPLFVTDAGDGSGRLFVVEQGGAIRVVQKGRIDDEPFLDIGGLTTPGGEQGLLGLAFHPDFESNGHFFINYTDTAGDTVVARYETTDDGARALPDSARVLLRIDQPFANHNGGHLDFGPDGYLYIATGDGGSAGDPEENGQNVDALLGKLLRIDVDRGSPYAIPRDNPFSDGDGAPEVWHYGLRNPWRFSFEAERAMLWIGDVGQGVLEEIDRVPAGRGGLNFGWNEMEGSRCYEQGCDPKGMVLPVTEYGHDQGCSVTGGYVYSGERFPDMVGGYFFGDYCSGSVWAIPNDSPRGVEPTLLASSGASISSFGLDERGELYVTDIAAGRILQVVDAS